MNPVQFLSRLPLRRQVVAVTVLLVLPMVAVGTWAALRGLSEREADLRDEASSIASTAEASLEEYLTTFDSLGAVLAEYPAVKALDPAGASGLFRTVLALQPTVQNVTVVDRTGVLRGSALPAGGQAPRLPPYAQEVLADGRPAIGAFTIGGISRTPTIIMGYPVRGPSGELVGVLGIGLNLLEVGKVFASISLPPGSVITLADAGGRVLARTLDPEKFVGRVLDRPGGTLPPAMVPQMVTMTGLDGIPRVFGNRVIERGPWLLSVGIPRHVAFVRVLPQYKRNLVLVVTFLIVAFGVSFLLVSTVTRPLGQLTSVARRIAEGDLSPPPRIAALNLEAEDLHRAFETMSANLREARARLAAQVEEERRMHDVLQSLQRQVVRQERLAAVGVLVSGVAHELNNPLQAILGGAELLEGHHDLSSEQRSEVDFIKTQSERARDIIRKLSRFSSQQAGPPEPVDLREVVNEVIELRKRDFARAGIAFDVEIASSRRVYANFTEVEQVLLNFVINAQHAIESQGRQGGRVTLRLADAGRRVRVEVLDDGPGVAPGDEPKLFQPFFTTKPVGKGTGLGLSVSYGIIESYGGSIGHCANEWGGATFFFELPAADAARAEGDDRTDLLHGPVLPRV